MLANHKVILHKKRFGDNNISNGMNLQTKNDTQNVVKVVREHFDGSTHFLVPHTFCGKI